MRRDKAVRAIRAARGAIVRIAAEWQAANVVDTSPLTEPLFQIQTALAVLEEPDAGGNARAGRRRGKGARGATERRAAVRKKAAR